MRPVSIVLCVALVALNGFSLAPASNRFQWYVLAASLVLALALLVLMLVGRGRRPQAKINSTEAANPLPVAAASNQAEAEIVSFLATLQERGRLGNPELLLLDEPSEGLAPLVVESLLDNVRALKAEGVTILLAEQGVDFSLALADRVYILEKGSIRHTGPAAELRDDTALRDRLLAL